MVFLCGNHLIVKTTQSTQPPEGWKKPLDLHAGSLCFQLHASLDYPYYFFLIVLMVNTEITNSRVEVAV